MSVTWIERQSSSALRHLKQLVPREEMPPEERPHQAASPTPLLTAPYSSAFACLHFSAVASAPSVEGHRNTGKVAMCGQLRIPATPEPEDAGAVRRRTPGPPGHCAMPLRHHGRILSWLVRASVTKCLRWGWGLKNWNLFPLSSETEALVRLISSEASCPADRLHLAVSACPGEISSSRRDSSHLD